MGKLTRIGMDTSKSVFQLHGVDDDEKPALKRKLRRQDWPLIGTGRDHHIGRLDRAAGRLRDECAGGLAQRRHRDAAADRRRDERGVGVDVVEDVA